MHRPTKLAALAVALTLVTAAFASVPAWAASTTSERSVKLDALFVRSVGSSTTGGTNPVTVRISSRGTKEFRVGFTEDEVAGTGDSWRAAGWNAATVATLLSGSPLAGNEITFDVTGEIDGPSAGALMTVGILSLLRGEKVNRRVTMTGTINPDGTIGPVGGIPYKVDGAKQANKRTMLIPVGQRNSLDDNDNLVDVVNLGRENGIEVKEVDDIYQAYTEFTGKALPRAGKEGKVRLSEAAYGKIQALTKDWMAEFSTSAGQFNSLNPSIQQLLTEIATQANDANKRAQTLSEQGLQAGAFTAAIEATAFARAGVTTGRALETFLAQGPSAFVQQIKSSAAIGDKVEALFANLKTNTPETISEAAALIDAYGGAIDALSVSSFGSDLLDRAVQGTGDNALSDAVVGAVYFVLAGTLVDGSKQLVDIGTATKGGARLRPSTDVAQIAAFFRKASDANLNAFDQVVLNEAASDSGVSLDQERIVFSERDFDYALANSGRQIMSSQQVDKALGGGKAAAYADLGGAVALYSRSSSLIAKYYALRPVFDNGEIVSIRNEQALTAMLDLGQSQVERSISVLLSKRVDPTLEVGGYEIAGVEREGDLSKKLDAIDSYLSAFVESRVLAYLGGFQKQGLS